MQGRLEWTHNNVHKMLINKSTSEFAGYNGRLSLRQVLGCGYVVSGDLSLLCWSHGQLFVLHFGFSHVVVTRIKVLLL